MRWIVAFIFCLMQLFRHDIQDWKAFAVSYCKRYRGCSMWLRINDIISSSLNGIEKWSQQPKSWIIFHSVVLLPSTTPIFRTSESIKSVISSSNALTSFLIVLRLIKMMSICWHFAWKTNSVTELTAITEAPLNSRKNIYLKMIREFQC